MSGFLIADFLGGAQEVSVFNYKKHEQEETDASEPHGEAAARSPPEWDAHEVAQKERGVADGGEAASDVGDDKDEEDNVVGSDAVLVHAQPGPNEEHGGAGGAKQVGDNGADKKKDHIDVGRGFALDGDVNAARDDKQGADQGDETEVLMRGVPNPTRLMEPEEVISDDNNREAADDFRIVAAPPIGKPERSESNRRQEEAKGRQQHDWDGCRRDG